MIEKIIKRNGVIENYNPQKVVYAIQRCARSINFDLPEKYTEVVCNKLKSHIPKSNPTHVEEIQDFIVSELKKSGYMDMAKAYTTHRDFHEKIRDAKYNKDFYDTIFQLVNGEENDVSRENANKNATRYNVMRDLIAGETCKKLYRSCVLPDDIQILHDSGIIHVHDMDYRLQNMTNCCLVNIKDMFENGTVLNGKTIRTPNSLQTASTAMTQIIMAIGSEQYGGISVSLGHLAPYIEKSRQRYIKLLKESITEVDLLNDVVEKLLQKEIESSMQTINYQLNTMATNQGQSPFITIYINLFEDPNYIKETNILAIEFLKQRITGMVSKRGININPTFPKIIYVLDDDNIHESSKYFETTKLAAKCISKRMVPDLISAKVMRREKEGNVYPMMGCRSCLNVWKDENDEYKFYGRLNLGVISVNLPYIAMMSNDKAEFYEKLDDVLDKIVKEQVRYCEKMTTVQTSRAPTMWNYGAIARLPEDAPIGDIIRNGYASVSIGYCGLAEAVHRFGVKYTSEDGKTIGLEILKHMSEYANKAKQETGWAFSIYGTPSESLTTKFAKALKVFPIMKNVNDKEYITNSYHVPVTEETTLFDKLRFESSFQNISTGGAISYVEMPDVQKNEEAVITTMQFIYENILYAELNTTSCDVCYSCGRVGELESVPETYSYRCPECGEDDQRNLYACRRVCGYLGDMTKGTSKGRFKDIHDRVRHA